MRFTTRATGLVVTLLALTACEQNPASRPYQPEQVEVEELRPITLTPYARLPEQDPSFLSVDVTDSQLVFHYDGAPEIVLEAEHVVSGVLGGGYLRRITAITDNGDGSWTADTLHAELGELIQDGHFRVHMTPGTNSFTEEGVATENLEWSLLPPGGSLPCTVGVGGSISVNPTLSADFDMDVDIDMRFCWRRGRWGIRYPSGCLNSAHFIASGSVGAGVEIRTSRNVTLGCSVDLIPEARAEAMSREWTTTFAVGPVPVVITHQIGPTASFEASGMISTGATTLSASGRVGIRAGAEYRGGRWSRIWEPSGSGSAGMSTATCGAVGVSAELSAGIEYSLKIYDAAGPEISYGPRVAGEYEANFGDTQWTASVEAGLGGSIGASLMVPVLDITLAEISWDLPSANVFERMYMGPLNLCADAGRDAGRDSGRPTDGGMTTPRDSGSTARDSGPVRDAGYCQPLRTGCGPTATCCLSDVDMSIQCIAGRCDDIDTCVEWDEGCTTGSTAANRCCGGLQCTRQSSGAALSCCVAAAGVCRSASDCCGDMPCTGGRCVARATGGRCFSTFECGGSDVCRTDGTCGRP